MPEQALNLILMGTGPFAVPSFQGLLDAGHRISSVIARPANPGRGGRMPPPSPVVQWANANHLPVVTPASINDPESQKLLESWHPDLLVVCDYGQILKRTTLATAKLGGINLHGSLLPAYRGAAPVQCAVWHGETETGVSVIHMTPRLDGGPILAIRKTAIGEQETAGELEVRLSDLGVPAVLEAIEKLQHWDGSSPLGEPQDDSRASGAPRLSKQDGKIDWSRSAREIQCQIRAMQPWPGAYCTWTPSGREPIHLIVRRATPLPGTGGNHRPGEVMNDAGALQVATGAGILQIDRLQAAGKREMTAEEYRRGNPIKTGDNLSTSG